MIAEHDVDAVIHFAASIVVPDFGRATRSAITATILPTRAP